MYVSIHTCMSLYIHVCLYTYMYVSIHICMYVCMYVCVCVCEREKPIKKERSNNIIYYTISSIFHICFGTISNFMFIR